MSPNTAATSMASSPAKGPPPNTKHEIQEDVKVKAEGGNKSTEPGTTTTEPVPDSEPIPDPSTGDQSGEKPSHEIEDEGELSDGSSVAYEPTRSKHHPRYLSTSELIKKAKKRLGQHINYEQLEGARLSRLEGRVEALEHRDPSPEPETKDPTPQRIPAIPTPNFVEWAGFKKLKHRGEAHHAIDVLVGEPVLFHQYQKNAAMDLASEPVKMPAVNLETVSKDFPDRIRINSIPLLTILRHVCGNEFKDSLDRPMVVLRPYKPLIYHLKTLQEKLNILNSRWGVGMQSLSGTDAVDPTSPVQTEAQRTEVDESKELEPDEEAPPTAAELHESAEARDDLQCLIRFLEERLANIHRRLDQKKPKVFFHDLWHVFKPGTLLFIDDKPDMAWKVLQATGGRNYLSTRSHDSSTSGVEFAKIGPFLLDCYYIDYDGQEFGPMQYVHAIKPFEGEMDITSLGIYPVQYSANCAERLKQLSSRGETFVKASKIQHMYCKGRTLTRTPSGRPINMVSHSEDLDSPVIIDFDRTLRINPEWRPRIGWEEACVQSSLETSEMTLKAYTSCGDSGNCYDNYCCMNDNIVYDYSWDRQRMNDFVEEREKQIGNKQQKEVQGPSSEVHNDEWKLLPNRVFGFVLRTRKWGKSREYCE